MSPTPDTKAAAAKTKEIEAQPDERAAFDSEESNVTPEEQHQYDTVVYKAMEMLYSDERMPALLEKLKAGAKNISKEIGHTAAMVLTSLEQTVAQNDQEIPEEILFNAGGEIVSQIVDIAVAAKIVSPEQEQDVAEAAFYEGLRIYGQNMGRDGKITDERALAAKEQMRQAGIEQDSSGVPGHGPEAAPAPEQSAAASAAPGAPPAPPVPGIVNQVAGAQQ
jgi:hypothetical protein